MATLTSYRTQVRALLNEAGTAGFWADSELNQWINDGADEVALETKAIKKTATFSTVVGTESKTFASIAADFLWPVSVRYNGSKLQLIDLLEENELDPTQVTTQGTPSSYFIWGETLFFEPIPDAAKTVKLWYIARATSMSGDTDTPGLPSYLDRCVVLYACARAQEKDHEIGLNNMFQVEYEKLLQRNKQRARLLDRDRYATVKDVEDYDNTQFGIV